MLAVAALPGSTFASFTLENTEVPAGTPVPTGASGAWVILVGQGGPGGTGGSQSGSNHTVSGGVGGGGGARVGWGFVPVSAMGSTYSLTAGTFSTASGSPLPFATFISGGVTLSAGWGNPGGFIGQPGVASQSGISGIPMGDGGSSGANTTDGAGAGGGNGGTGDSHGAGSHTSGSPGGVATGGGTFDGLAFTSQNGGNGSAGTGTSSLAKGGNGGGGGGAGAGSGQSPGAGYIRIKWV
jgi:hypothetical protein